MSAPLSPERLAEIRSTLLGEWLAGGWRVRSVPSPDGGRDQSEVYLPGSAAVIATFPDWADSVAVFLADAHEAVPDLLAEVERLTARVAELEAVAPKHGFEAEYQGESDAKRRLANCKHCHGARTDARHTDGGAR